MNNLVEKASSNLISTQSDLDKYYEENVKELSTKANTKATIYGIIEDYKKAVKLAKEEEKLRKKLIELTDDQAVANEELKIEIQQQRKVVKHTRY